MKAEKKNNVHSEQEQQHYDIFLSYKREDKENAMRLKAAIQSLGYTVFYDQDILEGESNWRKTIARNVATCRGLVFFRTENSVTSKYCQAEVMIADEEGKTILPVSFQHNQKLPVSDELKMILQPLQTTRISDFSNVAVIKNELQTALLKAFDTPSNPVNSLQIIEFINWAAENLSSRYRTIFDRIVCDSKITTDVDSERISLKWKFSIANMPVSLGITLNKFSKRPICYANCQNKQSCKLYNETGKVEYSVEACLDALEYGHKTIIENCLADVLKLDIKNCKTQGFKYFFRKQLLPGAEVNEQNDFKAVLAFLEEAVAFYDQTLEKLENYLYFATDVCKIFQKNSEIVSGLLNEIEPDIWQQNRETDSGAMLHFYKKNAKMTSEKSLGELCSVSLRYPEALRIKLYETTAKAVIFKILRFEMEQQRYHHLTFSFDEWKGWSQEEKTKLKKEIKDVLCQEFTNGKYRYSTIPDDLHKQLASFIEANPQLHWEVEQSMPNAISAAGYFQSAAQTFSQVRFALELTWHGGLQTVDWKPSIISDSDENEAVLSKITGYSVEKKTLKASIDDWKNCFEELTNSLQGIHDKVYEIYTALHKIDDLSCTWRPYKAATVLTLNNNTENASYINAFKTDETCWEYYLSSGTRLCRRLRDKDYPLMFNIRFSSAGACNATIGWYGDRSFKKLSFLEKKLFWHYVLSQFPENLRNSFACRENEIFLTDDTAKKDLEARKPKLFQDATAVEAELTSWLQKNTPDSLMEQMFQSIETAVKEFNIYTDKKTKA